MRWAKPIIGGVLALAAVACGARADDFRIETKVFANKGKGPVSVNTTLFHAGCVYDYLMSDPARPPEQIAVFDQVRGRFILLDPAGKLKTELKTDEVLSFAERLHDLAAKSSNPLTKFAADPQFDIKFSDEGELTLASAQVNYKIKTLAANTPEAAQQYREFSDWYARFNTMLTPGSTPPFSRLVVNAELAKRGLVPTEVQLTIRNNAIHSEHHVSWRLLPRDDQRIAETGRQLATFKLLDFEDFQVLHTARRN